MSAPLTWTVEETEEGRRLDAVVAGACDLSRNRATARVRDGAVTVDGRAGKPSQKVHAGQQIEVAAIVVDEVAPSTVPLPPLRFHDEHLAVVAKPAGLVVHPGAGHPTDTLVDALRAGGVALAPAGGEGRPGIVHRLDRDTSGLLVVASSDAVHAALVAALRRREVTRRYVALVVGVPASRVGRIEAPIGRHPSQRTRFATVSGGKPATTRYEVVAEGLAGERPVALLACTLETGRTHQIRVHLQAIGHPVVGDAVYGPRPAVSASLGADRPFLHAARLAFAHPVTGAAVDVLEPLPDDLVAVVDAAGIASVDLATLLAPRGDD